MPSTALDTSEAEFHKFVSMEDSPQALPQSLEPISRPSSTSTSASASLPQLPGISALAAATAASSNSPQMSTPSASLQPQEPQPLPPPPPALQQSQQQQLSTPLMFTGASPAATSGGNGSNLPTCQNCSTSTTPLWRRDEYGSVLCNACGLFLKLHGRPRPISLKTDVIKSRNRVKTMRPDLAPKKKQQQQQQQQQAQNFNVGTDHTGIDLVGQHTAAAQAARRASQKATNGQHDGSDSPISRTGTPSMYNHPLPSFMVDDPYQTGVSGFGAAGSSDAQSVSPLNGDRSLDTPQTHEQLIAHNSSLKTRVSELEVINELFRGRLSQLEQQEAAARRGQEVAGVEQSQLRTKLEASEANANLLRAQLEDSHRRENNLKRRLDELELELKELKEAKEALEAETGRPAKKARIEGPDEKTEDVPIRDAPEPAAAVENPGDVAEPAQATETAMEASSDTAMDTSATNNTNKPDGAEVLLERSPL